MIDTYPYDLHICTKVRSNINNFRIIPVRQKLIKGRDDKGVPVAAHVFTKS